MPNWRIQNENKSPTFDRYNLKFTNVLQNADRYFLVDQKEMTFCTVKGYSEFTEEVFDELCAKLKRELFHKENKEDEKINMVR